MAMTVTIAIALDENHTYSPVEAAVIAALAGDVESSKAAHPSNGAAAVTTVAEPAEAPKAPAAKAPVKRAPKAAPAAESAASTTPAVLDTTLDEPAAAEEDDLVGDDEVKEYTMEEVMARASEMISKDRARVVAALKGAGVKKVGELKGNAAGIAAFMEALV